MKITYLLTSADGLGGTQHAILTQANHMAWRHEVEVIGVFRTADEIPFSCDPRVRVRHLIDARDEVQHPVAGSDLDKAACRALQQTPSRYVERQWEPAFNALSDIELDYALRELESDVLVTSTPALMAYAAQLAPARVALVAEEHRVSERRGRLGEPLFRFAAQVDALVPLTQRSADWFVSGLGESAPLIRPLPNALPQGFRPRSSLEEKVIACVCRLVPEKQVGHAVQAFAQVVADHPGWELKIFGQGPDLSKLRLLAKSLEVQDSVHFYGPTPHVAEELAKASISVLSSRAEAWPLVIMESWAAGVPVVSYDCPTGPGELITDGVDGVLVPSDEPDALADGMRKLIEDSSARHRMGQAGAEAVQRYSAEEVTRSWEQLFAEVLEARRDPDHARRKADRVARFRATTGGLGFAPTVAPGERPLTAQQTVEVERELLSTRPDLIRSGGTVSLVSDAMGPSEVAVANLELVADALEAAGEPFHVIRDRGVRHRVVVKEDRADAVLAALAEYHGREPVYAERLGSEGRAHGTLQAGALAGIERSELTGLRVFRPVVTPGGSLRMGPAYGCDVELWTTDGETGALQHPRPTVVGDELPVAAQQPARCRIREREYPTFEPFTRDLADDITFPIDVVYSWVDGSDPAWQQRKARALDLPETADAASDEATRAAAPARFRSRDELRYSLRSLAMFAPWVRHIYLVTDDQRPEWLNTDHPQITVVDHREIFPDSAALPNFNSHAIGSCVHRIEGLAEHFLYFNDDVFLARPVPADTFFLPNGSARQFRSPTTVPIGPPHEPEAYHFLAGQNARRLIEEAFGQTLVNAFLHTPQPLRRSVFEEMEERWPEEFARTRGNRLRQADDVQLASTLHHYYAYFTGRSVPGKLRSAYANVGRPEHHPLLTQLLTLRNRDVFCLNDTHDSELSEEVQEMVMHAFLENYFPVASPYERPVPSAVIHSREGAVRLSGGPAGEPEAAL